MKGCTEILGIFGRLKYGLDRLSRTRENIQLYRMAAEMVREVLEWKFVKEHQAEILGGLGEGDKYDLCALVKNY